MGSGDDTLGRELLASFLKTLAASTIQIDMIGCVNNGIFLTTEASPVIETLRKMEEDGAEIATCGTCLDYHKLRSKLLIGRIGTMEQTVEIMARAEQVIHP